MELIANSSQNWSYKDRKINRVRESRFAQNGQLTIFRNQHDRDTDGITRNVSAYVS